MPDAPPTHIVDREVDQRVLREAKADRGPADERIGRPRQQPDSSA